jgi:uncharacterized membrane protein
MERGISLASFGLLLVAALVAVPLSGSMLPALVASHFDASGAPNGFMPRGVYLLMMTALAAGLPLLMVASVGWRTKRNAERLKLPNRDYWLAPERRAETAAYLAVHMTRLGSALIVFLGYVHALVVAANLRHPLELDLVPLLAGTAVFVLVTLVWVWRLHARFAKPH